eukprot:gene28733-32447_t
MASEQTPCVRAESDGAILTVTIDRPARRNAVDGAVAAAEQAKADVEAAAAALDTARINLDYTKVAAPISGRISRSNVTPGALVTANQATAMTTVQQLDPIHVHVTQSSSELLRLKRELASGRLQRASDAEARIQLVLEDGSKYPHPGRLTFSGVTVDAGTGSVTLRAVVPNPDRLLMPGMYVRAVLQEGVNAAALLVPQQAVTRAPDGSASALNGHVDLGTGIQTALGQIVAEELELGMPCVRVMLGDTARAPNQGATIASASIQIHAKPLRMAFGSCRTSVGHDKAGNDTHGVDALRAYALRMAGVTDTAHRDDPDPGDEVRWPDLVLFLGDQVYADETTQEMKEFIDSRRDIEQAPWTELQDYEEYAHLYCLAWTDPANRWLLSTVPTAMIFDDHDVRDDWNTSRGRRGRRRSSPS